MYIGIDLGTSAVKLLLVNEDGYVLHSVSKAYPLQMPQTNWAQQNPEDWWIQTMDGLKEIMAFAQNRIIKGISFSGQMHGLVLLDANDQVIRPAILWCDQRTQEECDYLNQEIGIERLLAWTGNQALCGFSAPKLLWVKRKEPENFKRIKKILLPKDYIQYKLTGVFASDVSDASGTLFMDVKRKIWSKEMLEILGIRLDQLPPIYESYAYTGDVKLTILQELHISYPIKVAIGAGDQAAGALGVGVVESGILSLSLGTSGVVFAPCDFYRVDPQARLHSFAHANGLYHQMGVILSAAGALKWWMETVNETCDYELMLEQNAARAEAKDLFFLPYLIGERTPHNDSHAKGCFIGLNLTHTKADMTKALLEGISFALRDSYEIIKTLDEPIHEIRISGGGSKSKLWNQLLADIFHLPLTTIATQQGPAYGAAILAKACVDQQTNISTICQQWIKPTKTYYPSDEQSAYYDYKYKIFHSLYPTLKDTFAKINK